MKTKRRAKPRYNVRLMEADMAGKGLLASQVADRAKLHPSSVGRFLKRVTCHPPTAKAIADAIGHPLDRYLVGSERKAEATR